MLRSKIFILFFSIQALPLKGEEQNINQTNGYLHTMSCFFNYKEAECKTLSQKKFQAFQALGFSIASCGMTSNGLIRFSKSPNRSFMESSDLIFSALFCTLSLKTTLEQLEKL